MRDALAPLTPCPLSGRELQILRLTAQGRSRGEIAALVGLADSTIKTHRHRMYRRLGVTCATEAVMHACRSGWLPEYLPETRRAAPVYLRPDDYDRPVETVHLPEHDTEGARA